MKKILTILILILSINLHAQYTRVIDTAFKYTEEEKPSQFAKIDGVYYYKPCRFMKLSFSQKVDPQKIYKIIATNSPDYHSIYSMDMRIKFYISKRIRFVAYSKYNGFSGWYSVNGYRYFAGVIIKI